MNQDISQVYLHPGDVYIARCPTIIYTVLGSCVSITFYSPEFRIGAMCHGTLPQHPTSDGLPLKNNRNCFHYMDCSILRILQFYKNKGIDYNSIIIKMFGGAKIFGHISKKQHTIGRQNIDISKKVLRKNGIHAYFSDIGGNKGRRIAFNSQTGHVASTLLQTSEDAIKDLKETQQQLVKFFQTSENSIKDLKETQQQLVKF